MEVYFLLSIIIIGIIYLAIFYGCHKENFEMVGVLDPQSPWILPENPDGMELNRIDKSHNNVPTNNPNLDNLTNLKLSQTIRVDNVKNQNMLAYNDVHAYNPGGVPPYNISDKIVAETLETSPVFNADRFRNSYYDVWVEDQ